MSDQHLISRPARLVPCHGCHRHILAAIDGGLTVAADPQTITPAAEIAARITGRAAYDIVTTGTRIYLVYRDLHRIRGRRGYPVVADHECAAGARPYYRLIPPKTPVRKKAPVKVAQREMEEIPF
jgi:hypothetical protein